MRSHFIWIKSKRFTRASKFHMMRDLLAHLSNCTLCHSSLCFIDLLSVPLTSRPSWPQGLCTGPSHCLECSVPDLPMVLQAIFPWPPWPVLSLCHITPASCFHGIYNHRKGSWFYIYILPAFSTHMQVIWEEGLLVFPSRFLTPRMWSNMYVRVCIYTHTHNIWSA